jgi:hypothetical protein
MLDVSKILAPGLKCDKAIKDLGTFVAQNEQKYVGTGLAHTSNLATCTALAMYSRTTTLSFLFHADASTHPFGLAGRIDYYIRQVNRDLGWGDNNKSQKALFCNEIEIWILTPPGNNGPYGSETVVREALEIVGGPELLRKVKTRKEDIDRETRIVVGPRGVEIVLTRAQRIMNILEKVQVNPTWDQANSLYELLQSASPEEWKDAVERNADVYTIAKIAGQTHHRELFQWAEKTSRHNLSEFWV